MAAVIHMMPNNKNGRDAVVTGSKDQQLCVALR